MRVFISYSHEDNEYAKALYAILREMNTDAWMYDLLKPGEDWQSIIRQKLEESDIVFLLDTPDSLASTSVQDEMEVASTFNKKIVRINVHDLELLLSQRRKIFDEFAQKLEFQNLFVTQERLAGNSTTDAPPPDAKKKKPKGK